MTDWRFDLVPAPQAGAKATGFVDWGDPILTGWEWPYVAISGAHPGPSVLVIAGIHGSEYVSIDAAVRLGASLDPVDIRGQVLCLPLMNPAAFWQRTPYVSPVDNLNPNRAFPGKPLGTFTERLAWQLTERGIRHADALLDLHGGDIPEALVPFTIYEETGNRELDERARKMAEAFGFPAMIVQPPQGGPIAGTTYSAAARLGVAAIIAEDGGCGIYDEAASDRMLAGAENTLRAVGVLGGGAHAMPKPHLYRRFVWIRSQRAGFFKPHVSVGDTVASGALLGAITDFFGNVVEEVVTKAPGRVLFLVVSSAIGASGLICGIGADA